MQRILRAHAPDLVVVGLDEVTAYDEPVEDRPTFEGNALLKARAGLAATGLPSVADDCGLCVDALNGMPGVLSARWSGPPKSDDRNNKLLLEQLADVPDERRGAYFACAVAFCHRTAGAVVRGEMHGRVIRETRGTAASATTSCSRPTSTPAPPGGADARGEGRDLPPRPGPARDRATHCAVVARIAAGAEQVVCLRTRPSASWGTRPIQAGAEGGTRTPTPEGTDT